jgi:hypothetical protein
MKKELKMKCATCLCPQAGATAATHSFVFAQLINKAKLIYELFFKILRKNYK